MEQKFIVNTVEELAQIVDFLKAQINKQKNCILLYGDLGSGKTALVKRYVQDQLSQSADSPTFSIVNEYAKGNQIIYHFDLYRLKSREEIEDIGFWDYIDTGHPSFIEWPEKIAELLPENQTIRVEIALTSNQCREYTVYY